MDAKDKRYVWYASYGSNISRERFLCYIQGGRPNGSSKTEEGCKDRTLPVAEASHVMHVPLYFAKNADRWKNQGVAFVGLEENEKHHTYSNKYLITKEQFMDVVKQENNGREVHIDMEEVIKRKILKLHDGWYGTILYLGNEEGFPVVTFTSEWNLEVPFVKPSIEYLQMIIFGMKESLGLGIVDICNYLIEQPGIKNIYDRERLLKIIQTV